MISIFLQSAEQMMFSTKIPKFLIKCNQFYKLVIVKQVRRYKLGIRLYIYGTIHTIGSWISMENDISICRKVNDFLIFFTHTV